MDGEREVIGVIGSCGEPWAAPMADRPREVFKHFPEALDPSVFEGEDEEGVGVGSRRRSSLCSSLTAPMCRRSAGVLRLAG